MSDHWDFYQLRVDGAPASIFVDLGIEPSVPLPSHPWMAYIRLHMNQPRPDGLSSAGEFDRLCGVEEGLEAVLCDGTTVYVGRNTSAGFRDFYFYVSTNEGWHDRVGRAMAAFEDYRWDAGVREDPQWSAYSDFLLPGEGDRQRIKNRHVLEALEQQGDALAEAREIDHWSYFPSRRAADAFLVEIEAAGFRLRSTSTAEGAAMPFGVQVWRVDLPSAVEIDEATLAVFDAARRQGGEYDGWESPVIRPAGAEPGPPLETGSEQLHRLAARIAIKTLIKAPLWFGLAAVGVYFVPTWSPWPWYVAIAFVAIGSGAAGLAWLGSCVARRREREDAAASPANPNPH